MYCRNQVLHIHRYFTSTKLLSTILKVYNNFWTLFICLGMRIDESVGDEEGGVVPREAKFMSVLLSENRKQRALTPV